MKQGCREFGRGRGTYLLSWTGADHSRPDFYLRHCAQASFRKQAFALEGLDWEIQKLLEQEAFNHFLNDSRNYRLRFLLSDNFIEYYGNKI